METHCPITDSYDYQMNVTSASTSASQVTIGLLLATIVVVAMTGNILVCVAIWTDRALRRIGNLYLVSLAIADLFIAAIVMSFALANDLMGYWPFGDRFCDTWISFDVMGCTASILHLCAVSLDRYLAIKDPMKYARKIRRHMVLGAIAAIWIVSGLVSFVPIGLQLHRPVPLRDSCTCSLDLTPPYALISSSISFYIPSLVMIALYAQLYRYAQRQVQSIKSLRFDDSQPSPSDRKAAMTLGIIVGAFLVCWVPFFCVNVIDAFCKTCVPKIVFQGLTWLGYCNSALNPVIYSTFNQEFRLAFRRILTGRRRTNTMLHQSSLGNKDSAI